MVLVAERLEGGPVSSRVSTFPDVFSMAKGGSKCTEGGRKPRVWWRLAPGEFDDDGNMFVKQRRYSGVVSGLERFK